MHSYTPSEYTCQWVQVVLTVQGNLFDIVSARLERVQMLVVCFHLQHPEHVDQLHQQLRLRVQAIKRKSLLGVLPLLRNSRYVDSFISVR
jgi:hypothetical protein